MNLGDGLRRLRATLHDRAGLGSRAWRRLDGSRALILCYHRVIPLEIARRDAVEEGLYVTPEAFQEQLAWLQADFRILPLPELASALAGRGALPERACAITFDDGWRDNYDFALPELERRRVPATIFVVADRVGTPGAFWPDEVRRRLASLEPRQRGEVVRGFGLAPGRSPADVLVAHLKELSESDREEPLSRLRASTPEAPSRDRELLAWDEIERMARAGIEIESHGASHAILTRVDPTSRDQELARARAELRERGYGRHDLLAYPSGAFDAEVRRAASAAGYRAAFSVGAGFASMDSDLMALPRFIVHDGISSSRAELYYRFASLA